ncbi:uncharacterized protein [Solanum tuberosum]|uniref:uncharacterized protein n=1 Tax=Solanum tuberosum TaxID=4113 RepID=UPI00073A085B|nr:PREDICTED: uncharacterized protein LOC107059648 [Solanum tuberosum]
MMKLRDDIQNFKQNTSEPIHELLLQYFYRSLDSVNKGIADQLVQGGIMLQPFEVASFLLDGMARVNQAWYTKEDQVSPLCFRLTQGQLDKEKERDQNIKKMLSQMEDLQEHMKGKCEVFRAEGGSFSDNFKSGWNQGRNHRRNEEGFHPHYQPRVGNQVNKGIADQLVQGGIMLQPFEVASFLLDGMARVNQAWYTKEDQVSPLCFRLTQGQLDKEKERDQNIKKMLSQMEDLQEHMKGKCEVFRAEGGSFSDNFKSGWNQGRNHRRNEEGFHPHYQPRVGNQGSADLLKGMRDDFSSLNSKVNSHANAIKMLKGQLNLISAQLTTTMPKENEEQELAVITRSGKKLSINLPLVEALLEMPGYGKFMKELVTKKRILDYEMIEVPYSCSAIMTKELITKREDPGAFTIPCTIGMLQFAKALCDLGASINLDSYAIYKELGLGKPRQLP